MKTRTLACVMLAACGDGGGSTPTDTPVTEPHTIEVQIGADPESTYAFQDGDGEWRAAPSRDGDTITLTIESERYAVAGICGSSSVVRVAYLAATEGEVSLRCNLPSAPPSGEITGTITSNTSDNHQLLHGTAFEFAFAQDESPTFSYSVPTTGTSDFVVVREPSSGDAIDVFHVERDLAVTGTVTRDLDFSTLEPPLLVPQPIPNDTGSTYTAFMPNPDVYQFSLDFVPPFEHTVLPVAARRATDRYDVGVIVDLEPDSTVQFDKILAVPTAVTAPTANLLEPLDVETGAQLAIGWNKIASASLSASINDAEGFAFTGFSQAWQDSFSGDLSFVSPDLSTVTGWPDRGALRSPADHVTITAVIETGDFPEDGHEAQVFQRSFAAKQKLDMRTRRTLEKARWHERARKNR